MGTPQFDPLIGTTFSERYYIDSLLGSGGMGSVYLARDAMNADHALAIKILHAPLCRDEKHVKRFLREVQFNRKIAHPNVVKTFDVGQHRGQLFFTMEYIEGSSLKDKLKEGRLSIEEIFRLLAEICYGLEAIHEGEIIHRDLKPANILLNREGAVKIADFGVALTAESNRKGSDEIVGSAGYMSPELWRSEDADATADIYSLGIVLYEMITGARPFDGASSTEVMNHHLYDSPVPPVSDVMEIPTWLTALVLMMLEKEPMKRPQSAGEVLSIIQSATRGSFIRAKQEGQARAAVNRSEKDGPETATAPRTRVKPGIPEQSSNTSTSGQLTGAKKKSASKSSKRSERGAELVPPVVNPARYLGSGLLFAAFVFFLLMGPSTVLLQRIAIAKPLDEAPLAGILTMFTFIAMGISLLVSTPSLILSAAAGTFGGQLLAFMKCTLYSFLCTLILSAVYVGILHFDGHVPMNNLHPLHFADSLNAGLGNLLEGAFLLPNATQYTPRPAYPIVRLQANLGSSDRAFAFLYFIGVILYFSGITVILKKQIIASRGPLSRVNYYSSFGIGIVMLVLLNILRPQISGYLPFDRSAMFTFSSGYFTYRLEMYSVVFGSFAWLATIGVYFASLAAAYNAALIDRVKRLARLHSGADPSRDVIGRH